MLINPDGLSFNQLLVIVLTNLTKLNLEDVKIQQEQIFFYSFAYLLNICSNLCVGCSFMNKEKKTLFWRYLRPGPEIHQCAKGLMMMVFAIKRFMSFLYSDGTWFHF